eukprot:3375735-Amphidinium_carterae.1
MLNLPPNPLRPLAVAVCHNSTTHAALLSKRMVSCEKLATKSWPPHPQMPCGQKEPKGSFTKAQARGRRLCRARWLCYYTPMERNFSSETLPSGTLLTSLQGTSGASTRGVKECFLMRTIGTSAAL